MYVIVLHHDCQHFELLSVTSRPESSITIGNVSHSITHNPLEYSFPLTTNPSHFLGFHYQSSISICNTYYKQAYRRACPPHQVSILANPMPCQKTTTMHKTLRHRVLCPTSYHEVRSHTEERSTMSRRHVYLLAHGHGVIKQLGNGMTPRSEVH